MDSNPNLPPSAAAGYDLGRVAEMYDLDRRYLALADIGFYAEEAARSGGPVLELGCGTGRVSVAMASRGVDVVCVDRSEPMLMVLTEKLASLPPEQARRMTVLCADARAVRLDRTFPLVTMPFRVLQHMVEVDDQCALLNTARRHLAPGGRLIFDVFFPDARILARGAQPEEEDFPWTPLDGGLAIRRTSVVHNIALGRQVMQSSVVYHVRDGAGHTQRHVHDFDHRYFFRWEIEHLLARCGLAIERLWADFARTPFDSAPLPAEQVVVCRHAGPGTVGDMPHSASPSGPFRPSRPRDKK